MKLDSSHPEKIFLLTSLLVFAFFFTSITQEASAQEAQRMLNKYCDYQKSIDPSFECGTLPEHTSSSQAAKEYLNNDRSTFTGSNKFVAEAQKSPVIEGKQVSQGPTFSFSEYEGYVGPIIVVLIILIIVIAIAKSFANRTPSMPAHVEQGLQSNFAGWDSRRFEELIANTFQRLGYRAEITPPGPDLGVDVIAEKGSERIVIQAKRWRENVGDDDVLKTVGTITMNNANKAIVITTAGFTRSAMIVSERTPNLELIDMEQLRRLIIQSYR